MKTTDQKRIQGTLKKERIKKADAYMLLDEIPPPSFPLNKDGMSYFTDFCRILLDNKYLTEAYIPIITRSAYWHQIYMRSIREIEKKDIIQIASKSGWEQKSGWFTVMMDAEDRMAKIEEKFGMNLYSNMKLGLPKPKAKNPLDDL
jgi:P27 family predicted phage terminase small subunit